MAKENTEMLVSIIIPVYNCQKYIEETIKSILAQEYENWELILVDDGSKDESGTICDRMAKEDNRITVFHIKNGGVSNARNYGIAHANGEYIQFVDADDLVLPHTLKTAVESIKDNEWLIFGYETFPISDKSFVEEEKHFNSFEEITLNYMYLAKKHMINSPWNKLYRRGIIINNQLAFDVRYSIGEDRLFNLSYLKNINKLVVIPEILYMYRRAVNESLTTKFHKNLFEILKYDKSITDNVFDYDITVERYTSINFIKRSLMHLKSYVYEKTLTPKEKITFISECINDKFFIENFNKNPWREYQTNKCILILVKYKMVRMIYLLYKLRAKISCLFQRIKKRT